ncbi:MAG: Xylose isomerase domain protein barrel [Verrucomicrobia bacterium]|jgi:sugar phosphate isomerase/epimerase|nr:Xylose isomerase domain protein barrel [Verrucomicrobiota bacterium]
MNTINRRSFLRLSAGTGLLAAGAASLGLSPSALAIEPIKRVGKPRFLLSLAAYGFRDYFPWMRGKQKTIADSTKQMDMFKFVDYCADHNCEGAELTSYFFDPATTTDDLLKLRRHAFLRGVVISGSAVGNNFARVKGPELDAEIADVKKWIDQASVLGAPHIRVFAGQQAKGVDEAVALKNCIEALEECCDYAGKKGIILGMENHGGIVTLPEQLLGMVKAVKSPWLGINLDTGNFRTEDPYGDLAKCAPYAVNVQVKVEIQFGPKAEKVHSDIKKLMKILKDANYQGFVALEYEAKPDPYEAIPKHLEELRAAFA